MNTLDNREIINAIRWNMVRRRSALFIAAEVAASIAFLAVLAALCIMGLAL